MRSYGGISMLPADLRQQLLAMPLTEDEKSDVAWALMQLASPPEIMRNLSQPMKNAPQADSPGAP